MNSLNLFKSSELSKSEARRLEIYFSSKADNSLKAVNKIWRNFNNWCNQNGKVSFPCSDSDLSDYLIYLLDEGKKVTTIEQAKWAIDFRHRIQKHPIPGDSVDLKNIIAGIRRSGRMRLKQPKSLSPDVYKNFEFGDGLRGLRAKLLITLGFAGGFRRSELNALNVEDVEVTKYGLRCHILKSKTNQEGKEEYVDILPAASSEICPIHTYKEWLNKAQIESGPVFRSIRKNGILGGRLSDNYMCRIIKTVTRMNGLDSESFSFHSLRAGFATFMLDKKAPINLVSKQLRHKKLETTLRYDRNSVAEGLSGYY